MPHLNGIGHQVVMREHHAFREISRAARVLEQRQVIRRYLDGLGLGPTGGDHLIPPVGVGLITQINPMTFRPLTGDGEDQTFDRRQIVLEVGDDDALEMRIASGPAHHWVEGTNGH